MEKPQTVKEIRDEYFDHDGVLSPASLKTLKFYLEDHIDNPKEVRAAISLVTDVRLEDFIPFLAKYLDHEVRSIRELSVANILGRLKLAEYAEKGLEMAQHDEDEGVRNMAVFSLGSVMNKVPFVLAQKIARHILEVFQHHEDKVDRDSAYFSILKAMEVPWEKRLSVAKGVKPEEIDQSILKSFCKKYQVSMQVS